MSKPHDEVCDGPVDEEHVVHSGPGFTMTGFRCGKCGFQTVTADTYVPAEKPCPRCGRNFLGLPDVPDELCDDCFRENLAAYCRQEWKL